MSPQDPLEGFRGVRPPSIQRALAANGDVDPETHHRELYSRLIIGMSAERVMVGLAELADAGRVVSALLDECEVSIREQTLIFLEQADPNCEKAREAHFRGRVALEIVNRLNSMVTSGYTAGNHIEEGL